jgi:hypothetical protein
VLHVAQPGVRSGRGRRNERLIVYLTFSGDATLPAEGQEQLVARLARTYFKTDGASTAALRTASEEINQYLLDRNRRSLSSGVQCVGLAALMVLRGDSIYAALSGPISVYQVSQGSLRHYSDTSPSNRGLGLARSAPYYFVSIQLDPGDLLVATPQLPAGWDGVTLNNLRKLPAERMGALLLERAIDAGANRTRQRKDPGAARPDHGDRRVSRGERSPASQPSGGASTLPSICA